MHACRCIPPAHLSLALERQEAYADNADGRASHGMWAAKLVQHIRPMA
jgi:hypothetical protein